MVKVYTKTIKSQEKVYTKIPDQSLQPSRSPAVRPALASRTTAASKPDPTHTPPTKKPAFDFRFRVAAARQKKTDKPFFFSCANALPNSPPLGMFAVEALAGRNQRPTALHFLTMQSRRRYI
jgi:hypothetical protein